MIFDRIMQFSVGDRRLIPLILDRIVILGYYLDPLDTKTIMVRPMDVVTLTCHVKYGRASQQRNKY